MPMPRYRAAVYEGGILVGRTLDRSRAQEAAAAAARGEGQVLTVAGEPGVGKTALARAVADDAAGRQGARVLWGECYEGSARALALTLVCAMPLTRRLRPR